MNDSGQKAAAMLRFCRIDSFEAFTESETICQASDSHTAVFCARGEGMIFSEGENGEVSPDAAYLLPPGRSFQIAAGSNPVKGWIIHFEAYRLEADKRAAQSADFLLGQARISNAQLAAECCDSLLRWQTSKQRNEFSVQAELYRFVSLLAEARPAMREEETTVSAITRIAEIMQQNPDHELKRTKLARLAGLSPGYFSWAFQHHIGVTPSAYLMKIRMERAKHLLLTGEGVRETAAKVGFDDEFYFSRRFKQQTTMSPLTFIKSRKRNIASVSEPLSGSLLALQLLPKAAVFYPHHARYDRMIQLHPDEVGKGDLWSRNLLALNKAKPDLIFCTDMLSSSAQQELELIAPTVSIPWLPKDWRQQLQAIAEPMEQQQEAEVWLSQYDSQAEKAYRKVRGKMGGATLSIWRVMDSEYRIYGRRNAGAVFYEDLRLNAAHNLDDIDVFCTVSQAELKNYAADIIILMVDSTAKANRSKEELQATGLWKQLEAVQNQRVYEIGTDKLFEYSAWSHERALPYVMQMFGLTNV
ncbi:hypothetical protein BBD42_05765 [Paenibacillus sp. BIHB 4019]|uniref:AraC family transcriptional regulator n=1 Tax=Paenibacillus sp. BIHB 4019 TaxID=1870819 RepID=A0A1B2DEA3_9BACL|nr:helix-turn-helix domain-containing protein [Paenibacillus sp. BIHB 4019]ANY66019.1 hypothetical protein BBD42_05765 [Paenibacillus sp. BIHB 4019]